MSQPAHDEPPKIRWTADGETHEARWRSESGSPPPQRVVEADDTLTANAAYRLACEGTATLWRGDFNNMRQLLQALARRADRPPRNPPPPPASPNEAFQRHRQAQSQRARTLGMLLLPLEADHSIPLRRAPDVRQACTEAYGPAEGPSVTSLRELLGLIGAHEWRKKGVEIPALDARIHAHYGVFSPVRGEYVDLVARAPLPSRELAFDIGTGTGVLAAVLARRGVARVIATDQDARAITCARENVTRLGLTDRVNLIRTDLYPDGEAPLIVCNPPWIPARPSSPLEHALYDPDSRMLRGFLGQLAAHLTANGEAWLILSDIAEHLGLRTRDDLLTAITTADLQIIDRIDTRPHHPRVRDTSDPLHAARAAETTSLWRLARASRQTTPSR
jgi:methylase of polypeptide subunit release factors